MYRKIALALVATTLIAAPVSQASARDGRDGAFLLGAVIGGVATSMVMGANQQPAPRYVEPPQAYYAPPPAYYAPPPQAYYAPPPQVVYVQPQPVYVAPPTYYAAPRGYYYGRRY